MLYVHACVCLFVTSVRKPVLGGANAVLITVLDAALTCIELLKDAATTKLVRDFDLDRSLNYNPFPVRPPLPLRAVRPWYLSNTWDQAQKTIFANDQLPGFKYH